MGSTHILVRLLVSAEAKAERIIAEELQRPGWSERDLTARRKKDPAKLDIAARLRRETTLPLKAIAARLWLGTSKSANGPPRKRRPASFTIETRDQFTGVISPGRQVLSNQGSSGP